MIILAMVCLFKSLFFSKDNVFISFILSSNTSDFVKRQYAFINVDIQKLSLKFRLSVSGQDTYTFNKYSK